MKRLRTLLGSAASAALLALAACRTPQAGPDEAECPVCRCEGDLACLIVRREPDTPSASFDGETFYFCSAECRARFVADPGAFMGR